jgi:hypothetical protein
VSFAWVPWFANAISGAQQKARMMKAFMANLRLQIEDRNVSVQIGTTSVGARSRDLRNCAI